MKTLVNNKFVKYLIISLIFILLVYYPVFQFLDFIPLYKWDESRLAINAFEMHRNGNWIVTYFEGNPDMWSTKPPLMIWIQVFFIKLLGVNDLAIRLPSALAAFSVCLLLFLGAIKYLKSHILGFIWVLLLLTSNAFIGHHISRTGDYDTLLVLMSFCYVFSWYFFIERNNIKFIYLTFLFLTLAVLTKGVAGLFFTPTLFIWMLLNNKTLSVLKNKNIFIGFAGFLSIVLGYYFLRESYNPGFLKAVYVNELGGRFSGNIEGHHEGFWFFFDQLKEKRLTNWFTIIPFGLLIGWFHVDGRIRAISKYTSLAIIQYLLIISISQTKLEWYDAPLFPLIAITNGFGVFFVYEILKNTKIFNDYLKFNFIPLVFLYFIFQLPYREVHAKTFKPNRDVREDGLYDICYFMKDAAQGKRNIDNFCICYNGYQSQNIFYLDWLKEKNINIEKREIEQIKENDLIFVNQKDVIGQIDRLFENMVVDSLRTVKVIKIGKMKY